jgi:outer membrane protein assembly factor BamB
MKTSDLVFVGIKGSVIALDRATGERVWTTHLKGSDFVNVVLHGDALFAACNGEIFCLEPKTGGPVWHNPLKGFGLGLATLALDSTGGDGMPPVMAEQLRRDAAAAAAS